MPVILLPALWGLVLLVSFIGFGALLRRLLFGRLELGWANQGAWGMAFLVVLGGLLNWLHLISGPLLLALVAAGFCIAVGDWFGARESFMGRLRAWRADARKRPAVAALVVAGYAGIVALAGIQYLAELDILPRAEQFYCIHDNLKGYFIFAKEMVQAGGMTFDPFDNMRLQNGLGGQSLLHALMLPLFDYDHIDVIDGGVALILCVGLLLRLAKERGLPFFWGWSLALFFLCVPYYPQLRINSSSFTTGMVMFLALFAFLDRDGMDDEAPTANALLVAMLAATAFALKTNLIPPMVLIVFLSYLRYVMAARWKRNALLETLLVPVLTFLMLLPWMLSLLHTSGTMLYPILGRGFDEYNYGAFPPDDFADGITMGQKLRIMVNIFWSQYLYLALLVLGAATFIMVRVKRRGAAHAFVVGSIVASVLIFVESDVSNVGPFNRYLYVCIFVSLLVVLIALLEAAQGGSLRRKAAPALVLATILLLVGSNARTAYLMYQELVADVMEEDEERVASEELIARHKKAQAAVPAGEGILSRDLYTMLYDFNRNRICNLNDPGGCSPPPGMPYFQGQEAMAEYLLKHKIRYVAYSYADQSGYPVRDNLWRLHPDRPYYHRITERAKVALDRVLGELGSSRKRVFDDGKLFVVDLAAREAAQTALQEPNYFQEGKILTLGWARTRGFDRNKVWTDGHGVIENICYQVQPQDDVLVLNTFGIHPWKGDLDKVQPVVAVNGERLPFIGFKNRSYYFSLQSVRQPITRITVDSTTFVPREEKLALGKADDRQRLGLDVDTIQIANREDYYRAPQGNPFLLGPPAHASIGGR